MLKSMLINTEIQTWRQIDWGHKTILDDLHGFQHGFYLVTNASGATAIKVSCLRLMAIEIFKVFHGLGPQRTHYYFMLYIHVLFELYEVIYGFMDMRSKFIDNITR